MIYDKIDSQGIYAGISKDIRLGLEWLRGVNPGIENGVYELPKLESEPLESLESLPRRVLHIVVTNDTSKSISLVLLSILSSLSNERRRIINVAIHGSIIRRAIPYLPSYDTLVALIAKQKLIIFKNNLALVFPICLFAHVAI